MSTVFTIGDQDFVKLMGIAELRNDPLFNKAVAAYSRSIGGQALKCCGGAKRTDSKEYITLAGAALRRRASSDSRGFSALIRSNFNVPQGAQISLTIGGGLLPIP